MLTAEELREGQPADLIALHLDPAAVRSVTSAKARKTVDPGPAIRERSYGCPVTARGGDEFPPFRARQSSLRTRAGLRFIRRTFLRAPAVAGAEIDER